MFMQMNIAHLEAGVVRQDACDDGGLNEPLYIYIYIYIYTYIHIYIYIYIYIYTHIYIYINSSPGSRCSAIGRLR